MPSQLEIIRAEAKTRIIIANLKSGDVARIERVLEDIASLTYECRNAPTYLLSRQPVNNKASLRIALHDKSIEILDFLISFINAPAFSDSMEKIVIAMASIYSSVNEKLHRNVMLHIDLIDRYVTALSTVLKNGSDVAREYALLNLRLLHRCSDERNFSRYVAICDRLNLPALVLEALSSTNANIRKAAILFMTFPENNRDLKQYWAEKVSVRPLTIIFNDGDLDESATAIAAIRHLLHNVNVDLITQQSQIFADEKGPEKLVSFIDHMDQDLHPMALRGNPALHIFWSFTRSTAVKDAFREAGGIVLFVRLLHSEPGVSGSYQSLPSGALKYMLQENIENCNAFRKAGGIMPLISWSEGKSSSDSDIRRSNEKNKKSLDQALRLHGIMKTFHETPDFAKKELAIKNLKTFIESNFDESIFDHLGYMLTMISSLLNAETVGIRMLAADICNLIISNRFSALEHVNGDDVIPMLLEFLEEDLEAEIRMCVVNILVALSYGVEDSLTELIAESIDTKSLLTLLNPTSQITYTGLQSAIKRLIDMTSNTEMKKDVNTYLLQCQAGQQKTKKDTGDDSAAASKEENALEDFEIPYSAINYNPQDPRTLLGDGAFGEVFKATWQGAPVAFKRLKDQAISGDAKEELRHEGKIMRGLRHPNIAIFYGICTEPGNFGLVIKLADNGSLYSVLYDPTIKDLSCSWRMNVSLGIARGLNFLHTRPRHPLLHRDLKSLNVLMDGAQPKLADFGLTAIKDRSRATIEQAIAGAGTLPWMAQELLTGETTYTTACDVFSFAVILSEIASRRQPWLGFSRERLVAQVILGNRPRLPSQGMPQGFSDVVVNCWAIDPASRPRMCNVVDTLEAIAAKQVSP